jgi:hypothetical protein
LRTLCPNEPDSGLPTANVVDTSSLQLKLTDQHRPDNGTVTLTYVPR